MQKLKKSTKIKIRIPHVLIDARGADPKLLEDLTPGLLELEARVRILGKGGSPIPHAFSAEEALEETQMWVVLGNQLPHELPMMLERGIVPILPTGLHPQAENYVPSKETGNAILFPKHSAWHVYGALVRALENFSFAYDWESLKNSAKELLA
jgi:hypothetical protein